MLKIILYALISIVLFVTVGLAEAMMSGNPITPIEVGFEFAEAAVIFGAVALASLSAASLQRLHQERIDLIEKVENARFEGQQWRSLANDYVKGLGAAITNQFKTWQFTQSEADIAMFILKGFSHREIAQFRKTSEATVRQQASCVYKKSGMRNHREFSAFFLEDLTSSQSEHNDLQDSDVIFTSQWKARKLTNE